MERDSCFSKGKDFSQQIRKAELKSESGSALTIFGRVLNLFSQPKSGFLPEVGTRFLPHFTFSSWAVCRGESRNFQSGLWIQQRKPIDALWLRVHFRTRDSSS